MKITNKKIHILIIILGILFILIPAFHSNLWFDESYTVGIVNNNLIDIWNIGINDVHPVLYYWILHIIGLIFGKQILVYRIFSVACTAILGIIGYTHIRKDFGEKTGILFSFFTYFLPVNIVYSAEIRMYSLAMLLVTIMSIYAYRIYKNKDEKYIKNWIIFAIFSLASAYTHYYGLMFAAIVNVLLFISIIIQAKKEKKITYNLKAFICSAVPQILLYLPWLIPLVISVSRPGSFWITIHFPETFIEMLTFPYTGNLAGTNYVPVPVAIIFSVMIYIYTTYIHIRNKKDENLKDAKFAIGYWLLLALTACLVSIIIWRVVIYARYMLCVGGLFIFFIASSIAKKGNKYGNIIICILSAILSVFVLFTLVNENYGMKSKEYQQYIKEKVEKDDLFICGTELSGFAVSVRFPENKTYFYDTDNWNVEKAYKAFGDTIYNIEDLNEYKGRIWITNSRIYEEINEKYDIKLIEKKEFKIEYKNNQYTLILIEKN